MAWVSRGSRKYYYQSTRVGGVPTRKYLGSGPEAEKAAAEVERSRTEKAAEAAALHAEEQNHAAATAPLDDLCQLTDLLLRATLTSLGFHQHARGAWRRRRHDDPNHDPAAGRGLSGGAEAHHPAGPPG